MFTILLYLYHILLCLYDTLLYICGGVLHFITITPNSTFNQTTDTAQETNVNEYLGRMFPDLELREKLRKAAEEGPNGLQLCETISSHQLKYEIVSDIIYHDHIDKTQIFLVNHSEVFWWNGKLSDVVRKGNVIHATVKMTITNGYKQAWITNLNKLRFRPNVNPSEQSINMSEQNTNAPKQNENSSEQSINIGPSEQSEIVCVT